MFFATCSLAAKEQASKHPDYASEFIHLNQYLAETGQFSGTAILSINGKPIATFADGQFNDDGKRITLETPFNIGSVGKLVTLAVVLQHVEQGTLSLASTIESIWPESKLENADQITIRHLLSHTSGYGDYFSSDNYSLTQSTIDDFIQLIRQEGTDFSPPGADMIYSNKAFWILAKLIEINDPQGRNWDVIVDQDVAEPLDVKFHRFQPDADIPERPNAYYQNILGKLSPVPAAEDPRPGPDGGLYMTVGDLQKFHQGLLNGKLFSPTLLNESIQPITHFEAMGCDVGLVWELCQINDIKAITKGGTTTGGGAMVASWQTGGAQISLVMLSNYHNAPIMNFAGIIKELSNENPFVMPDEHPTQWLFQQVKSGELTKILANPRLWYEQKAPLSSHLTLILFSMHIAKKGYLQEAKQLLTMQLEVTPENKLTQKFLQHISKRLEDKKTNQLNETISQLWAALSHQANGSPDIKVLKLLLHDDAVISGIRQESNQAKLSQLSKQEFLSRIDKINPYSFTEIELDRKTYLYNNWASVQSIALSERSQGKKKDAYKGINSIQLAYDGKDWKIISLFYALETQLPMELKPLEQS
jgi:CubicO group peptidase (beta-lactamase class C family)